MGRRATVANYSCCFAWDSLTVPLLVRGLVGLSVLEIYHTLLFCCMSLCRQQRVPLSAAVLFTLILVSPAITMAGLCRGPVLTREMRSKQRPTRPQKNAQSLSCFPFLTHEGHSRFSAVHSSFQGKEQLHAEKWKARRGAVRARERRSPCELPPLPPGVSVDSVLYPSVPLSLGAGFLGSHRPSCRSSSFTSVGARSSAQQKYPAYGTGGPDPVFRRSSIPHLRFSPSCLVNKLRDYFSERPAKAKAISPGRKLPETATSLLASGSGYTSPPLASVSVHPTFLEKLPLISRPSARRLLPQLSFDNPSMVPESPQMSPLVVFVREQKQLRPDKVLIIQVRRGVRAS